MTTFRSLTTLLVLISLGGCVSKSDHQALQAELDACRQENAQAQADLINWQQRFDREEARWNQIGDSVAEAVPNVLTEMNEERERILNLVPEQVQSQVSGYLDEYFNTVMQGFDRLAQDNQDLGVKVLGLEKAIEVLGKDTRSIGQDTRAIGYAIGQSLTDERDRRAKLVEDLADINQLIVEYDQTRLTCDGCPDRLRMRDKSRNAIVEFHQELMSDLSRLQVYASAPADADPTTTGEAPAEPLPQAAVGGS